MAWTSPRTWGVSETLTAAKMNEVSASLSAVGDAPTSYAASVLSGWTSNFTVAGWATNTGKWWKGAVAVTFTGAPAGSSTVNISLPATPSTAFLGFAPLGGFMIRDISPAAVTVGQTIYTGASNMGAQYSATSRLQNAAPYTLASGDTAWFWFEFWTD